MAYNSGARNALSEAASWLAAAAVIVGSVVFFDELKAGVAGAFGLPSPTELAEREANASALRETAIEIAAQPVSSAGNRVELQAAPDGHFYANARINGRDVAVMVDTGAGLVAMPFEAAESAGIYVREQDYTARTRTANGIGRAAIVNLSTVEIDGIRVRDVRAMIMEPGALHITLLGMSFMNKLHKAQMSQGRLILEQ